jgi:serine protease Do
MGTRHSTPNSAAPPVGTSPRPLLAKTPERHRTLARVCPAIALLLFLFALTGCDREPSRVVIETTPLSRQVGGTTSYSEVVDKVAPSVVSIYTRKAVRTRGGSPLLNDPLLRRFFGPGEQVPLPEPRQQRGLGSGVIISRDGYILSNNHVIEGADEITITTAEGRDFKAKVIGTDPPTDLAVLKIDADDLPAATLADSKNLRVGDIVLAIGNPFGVGQTVTSGIISATERSGFGITDYEDFIQTDASINPGNSGGALVDAQGRVIGINTAILSPSGGFMGIGLAVPISMASFVTEQIINEGRVIRGYLGVYMQPITPELARAFALPMDQGALIAGVSPDSPAAAAGLKEGDVIVATDGKQIASSRELRLLIAQTPPGTKINLTVLRQKDEKTIPITLAELPADRSVAEGPTIPEPGQEVVLEGVELQPLTPRVRQQLRIPARLQGVLLAAVEQGSAAHDAGLRPGQVLVEVNRRPVTTPEEVAAALDQTTGPAALLRVWAQGTMLYIVLDR